MDLDHASSVVFYAMPIYYLKPTPTVLLRYIRTPTSSNKFSFQRYLADAEGASKRYQVEKGTIFRSQRGVLQSWCPRIDRPVSPFYHFKPTILTTTAMPSEARARLIAPCQYEGPKTVPCRLHACLIPVGDYWTSGKPPLLFAYSPRHQLFLRENSASVCPSLNNSAHLALAR